MTWCVPNMRCGRCIGVYDRHFDEGRCLYLVTCQYAIRAINDVNYNKTHSHTHETLLGIYEI